MSSERADFLRAYDAHRVLDQIEYYEQRIDEYGTSAKQLSRTNTLFLAAAAACGAIGAVYTDQNQWLGLVAAGLSAAAAAAAAWGDVIGFSANSQLYRAALGGLRRLRPKRPDEQHPPAGNEIERYMTDVEEILLGEIRTWAEKWKQESSDPEPPASPS